ncbi:ABC transporter permease [Roseomonas haemaphysalidis]|uniref:ABC transporter permease n=1 Tax=Roseomonas haemaphysalidis TaxID=2768162 RepID=A0ABS3KV36_9PROT|nr:ABC transporter permease [Roseomonas haemaphysalidis]MBO1081342.1 ABC transporter permease [Roseomonas haemaphysalidis]
MSDHVPRRARRGALSAQLGVLHALVLREMQLRFGQSKVGYLWLVAEPMMLGFGVSLIHWMTDRGLPNNIPVFLFYALGYAPFYMFRGILTRNAGAITHSMPLLYHRSVKLHDLTMARTLLEAAACSVVIGLLVVGGGLFGGYWPAHPGLFVVSLVFSALIGHGVGTLLAALIVFVEPVERLVHPLTYLMMPFSAAFLMLASVTPATRDALLYNPLANVHEAMRHAQWGDKVVSYFSLPYVMLWILILNVLAMAAMRAARPRLSMAR